MRVAVQVGLAVGFLMLLSMGRVEERTGMAAGSSQRAEGLLLARCSVCHSTDLIRQQRVDRGHWQATVEKMQRWGAELSDDDAAFLIDYFSARYHPDAPDHLVEEVLVVEPSRAGALPAGGHPAGVARRGDGIFAQHCQVCHGAQGAGGMGPKLTRNPILTDEGQFWDTVEHGRGAMPAWGAALSPQAITDVWEWLKELE